VNDAATVGRFLREYHLHGVPPAAIRRLQGSVRGTSVTYRVAPASGPACVVRAFRADGPVSPQFSGTSAETMVDWVVGRARTLASLEEAGYGAPRAVRDRSGELVGETGPWLTWATTFVHGPVLTPSLDQLRMLGTALGRLHAVPQPERPAGSAADDGSGSGSGSGSVELPGLGGFVPGRAAWHPTMAVAATLARLGAVAALVPADWQPMYETFRSTAQAVQRSVGLLPEALVHGNAWPGNGVQTAPDAVTLIDWETAGVGLPVLDLGNCLGECHLDSGLPPDQPEAWLVQPDERRIAAVAAGYSAVRMLSPAERELLPDAVRFGTAFAGAIHFEAALTGGASGPSMDGRLARLRNRLAISDAVAELALRHLAAA
jgi:Ser/Thr protein kinase RdoA (MazF antagonist)